MAIDFFLQIDGIPGDSRDSQHKDWIDVLSWSWGESQSATTHPGTGSGTGKVAFSDLSFTQRTSKASPALFLSCASGKHIKQAKLSVRRATGKADDDFLMWTFSNLLVSSFQTGGSGGEDTIFDTVSLNFSKAQISLREQKADGSLDAPITAGWDTKTNTKV
jgi:type VI secretion system secreted protein Hcp